MNGDRPNPTSATAPLAPSSARALSAPVPSSAQAFSAPVPSLARAFSARLSDALRADPDVFLLGESAGRMGGSGGSTRGLVDVFPSRVIDTPTADRGVLGFALGMALAGRRPFVELAASSRLFSAMEVLSEAVAIGNGGEFEVPLVVRVPTGGEAGPRVDAAVSLALAEIDGLVVLAPGDAAGVLGALEEALRTRRPMIVLEPRQFWDHPAADASAIGADLAADGDQAVIVTWGSGLAAALQASATLADEGISAAVLHLGVLLPVNPGTIGRAVAVRGSLILAVPAEGGPTDQILRAAVDQAFLSYESPPAVVHAEPALLADAVRASVLY